MRNKLLAIAVCLLLFPINSFAAWNAAVPADNEKLKDAPALIRANWDAIATGTDSNLQITNAKVASGAAIVDTKLATISTAGKVSGAALTSLSSTPSGAGALPIVNGGTGQTTRQAALNALAAASLTGTSGQVLVSDGSDMGLGYPASLSIASAAQGDVLYYTGAVWQRLAAGTSGQFLKTQGASANPAWSAVNVGIGTQVVGTLNIVNGGTGQTTAANAINALLPTQTSNSGKFLTTNGTVASWGSTSNLSNVLFQYSAAVDQATTDQGEVISSSLTTTSATGAYRFLQTSNNGSYQTVWSTKWKKISGISTITIYAQVWDSAAIGSADLKVNVGSASGTTTGHSNTDPSWFNFTIDVSGLSDGTVYDVTAQLQSDSAIRNANMGTLIAFGS